MAKEARLSGVHAIPHPEGGWLLGVVAKRTYRVTDTGCVPVEEQVGLVEQPRLSADGAILIHDGDLMLRRAMADVIVQGHAYGPNGAPMFDAAVRVESLHRRVKVFGDRRCERDARGELRFGPPASAPKVPLTWENAYGGLDKVAHARLGAPYADAFKKAGINPDPRFFLYGYPRNPLGKGYLIEPSSDALEACALPNLEDPTRLLTPQTLPRRSHLLWPQGPPVAGFGWLNYNFFPRSVQLGMAPPLYDGKLKPEEFFEVAEGWLRPDVVAAQTPVTQRVDAGATQASAVGMRVREVSAQGGIELTNLHAKKATWRFTLPNDEPRLTFRLPADQPIEVQPRIRTLLLEPDKDRVCVVWVGEQRLTTPMRPEYLPRVEHAVEWRDAGPKSVVVPAVPEVVVPTPTPVSAAPAEAAPPATPQAATKMPTEPPSSPAAAPASLALPAELTRQLADFAKPGGNQRGGVIARSSQGSVSLINVSNGQAFCFLPNRNVPQGQTMIGVVHTHPDVEGMALSGGDFAPLLVCGTLLEIVQSGKEHFLLLRTQASPKNVQPAAIHTAYEQALRTALTEGKTLAQATQAATAELACAHGLAYYQGQDGTLKRIVPA